MTKELTDKEKRFALHGFKIGSIVEISNSELKVLSKDDGKLTLEPVSKTWYYMDIIDGEVKRTFIEDFEKEIGK